MNNWAITTSKSRGKHNMGLSEDAQRLANELQIPEIARDNKGIFNSFARRCASSDKPRLCLPLLLLVVIAQLFMIRASFKNFI